MIDFSLRRAWPAFLILLGGATLYAKLAYRHDVGFYEDDAIYILAARSLLSGHYDDLTHPEPSPEIHFLPGFPTVLLPFTALVHNHWNRLKVLPCLLAIVGGFSAWILYRRSLPGKLTYAALALFVFNPLTIYLSDVLLSEWWLLCLSLAAVIWIGNFEQNRPSLISQILLTCLLSWAALTRPEGILLTLGLTGALLIRTPASWKYYRWSSVVPFLVLFSWLLRNYVLSGQISTYAHLWQAPSWTHITKTLSALPQLALGIEPSHMGRLFLPLAGGFILLAGIWRECVQKKALWPLVISLYLLLFIIVRLVWSVFDDRFFLPILPFLCLFTLQGGLFLSRQKPLVGLFLLGPILINLVWQDIAGLSQWKSSPFDRLPWNTMAFIRDHLPPQATLLTNKGGLMTLYTAHFNTGSLEASTPDEFAYGLLKAGTSYVWVRRQPVADQHIQEQWMRVNRWMRDWSTAFPVLFDDTTDASTIYTIATKPSFLTAYESYLNAREALQKGNNADAQKKFSTALRIYSEFPGALNDYAAVLLESGDTKTSEAYLHSALRLRPHFALARLNLARVYERENKMNLAEQNLRLAFEAAEDDLALRRGVEEEQRKLETKS